MKIIRSLRRDWLALHFLLIPTVLTIYLWPQLPNRMATHWNAAGEVDGWLPKTTFALMMGGLIVFTYLLLLFILRIDSKPSAKHNQRILRILRAATMGLLGVTISAAVLFNVGVAIDIAIVIQIAVPLLLLVVGNLFSNARRRTVDPGSRGRSQRRLSDWYAGGARG